MNRTQNGKVSGASANRVRTLLAVGALILFASGCGQHRLPPNRLPAAPAPYSCSVSPASVFPGDPVIATGAGIDISAGDRAVYSWSVDGGATSTQGAGTAQIDTKRAGPGTVTVKGHVSVTRRDGKVSAADCSTSFVVKAFAAPTVSCVANPAHVSPGETATIQAEGFSPQNQQLSYSYAASAGTISGTGPTATLSTVGAPPGAIAVSCNVADAGGATASAMTTVQVEALFVAPAPPRSTALCSISFDRDPNPATSIDNEAKACLDDVALDLQRDAGSQLAIIGNETVAEQAQTLNAGKRAVSARDYLVHQRSIDASRIALYTGSANDKSVAMMLIPPGARLEAAGTPFDERILSALQNVTSTGAGGGEALPVPASSCMGIGVFAYPKSISLIVPGAMSQAFTLFVSTVATAVKYAGQNLKQVCDAISSDSNTCIKADEWARATSACGDQTELALQAKADAERYGVQVFSIPPFSGFSALPPSIVAKLDIPAGAICANDKDSDCTATQPVGDSFTKFAWPLTVSATAPKSGSTFGFAHIQLQDPATNKWLMSGQADFRIGLTYLPPGVVKTDSFISTFEGTKTGQLILAAVKSIWTWLGLSALGVGFRTRIWNWMLQLFGKRAQPEAVAAAAAAPVASEPAATAKRPVVVVVAQPPPNEARGAPPENSRRPRSRSSHRRGGDPEP